MIRLFLQISLAALLINACLGEETSSISQYPIGDGIEFFRILDLEGDPAELGKAVKEGPVIVDLRFVESNLNGTMILTRFLAHDAEGMKSDDSGDYQEVRFEAETRNHRPYPVLVLVNSRTSGPIEAALDAMQSAGDAILVGTPTAGETDWISLEGDSLRGIGVIPALVVNASIDEDRAAHAALDRGIDPAVLLDAAVEKPRFDEARLLQHHLETNGNAPPERPGADRGSDIHSETVEIPEDVPLDRTLHRAVNTLIAAKALGEL